MQKKKILQKKKVIFLKIVNLWKKVKDCRKNQQRKNKRVFSRSSLKHRNGRVLDQVGLVLIMSEFSTNFPHLGSFSDQVGLIRVLIGVI